MKIFILVHFWNIEISDWMLWDRENHDIDPEISTEILGCFSSIELAEKAAEQKFHLTKDGENRYVIYEIDLDES